MSQSWGSSVWLLPTRNRPEACQALIAAMQQVDDVPDVAVMQDGDPYEIDWPARWKIHSSIEHLEFQRAINRLFHLYPDEKTYGLITDHARPRSKWSKVLEETAGDWKIAYCKDNHERFNPITGNQRIPAASCMGGNLVRELGYVWPDFCTHMYGDDALEEIGNELGIITICETSLVDDLLSKKGEFPLDENNKRLWRGKPYVKSDGIAYMDWSLNEKPLLLERFRDL